MRFSLLPTAALLFLVSLTSAVSAGSEQHSHDTGRPAKPGLAASTKPTQSGVLPPLPSVSYAPARPMAIVRQVYEFAAKHPEVLRHVPCYCGCERIGHGGNHDCFVKSRSSSGQVTEWDSHGIGCTICLDVARDAMTLFGGGASVSAIRTAIDAKYASHYPSATPTPRPPRGAR